MTAVKFVFAQNLDRRHLTPGQKAACAVSMKIELNKTLKSQGGKNGRLPKEIRPIGRNAVEEAGAAFGISAKSVGFAAVVFANRPDLFEKMKRGDISLAEAHKEARPLSKKPFNSGKEGIIIARDIRADISAQATMVEMVTQCWHVLVTGKYDGGWAVHFYGKYGVPMLTTDEWAHVPRKTTFNEALREAVNKVRNIKQT